jgi:hypothetical protein
VLVDVEMLGPGDVCSLGADGLGRPELRLLRLGGKAEDVLIRLPPALGK